MFMLKAHIPPPKGVLHQYVHTVPLGDGGVPVLQISLLHPLAGNANAGEKAGTVICTHLSKNSG